MNFPSGMSFQYFFFDTFPGCFLQVLPIALIIGVVYGIIRFAGDKYTPKWYKLLSVTFVCYLVGLICLVCLFEPITGLWYKIMNPNGSGLVIKNFSLQRGANFVPDFFFDFNAEKMANILMFMPFGFLFPFFLKSATWTKTVLFGLTFSIIIEVVQPFCNRFFDINDIIMNTLGVIISATMFFQACDIIYEKANVKIKQGQE